LKPLDQAIGRANFIALRKGAVLGADARERPEIVAVLYAQAALLLLTSALLPIWFNGGLHNYLQDVLYLGFALFTNYWALDLQTTAWSVDLAKSFVRVSLVFRATCFIALGALWVTKDFLLFAAIAAALMAVFTAIVALMLARRSDQLKLALRPARMTAAALRAHGRLIWTSLLTTLSELVVLNSAYALISAVFGVGAAVITFDSIMKIVRLAMNATRTLAEIALPRHSRMAIEQDRAGAARLTILVVGVCVGGMLVPALALAFAGPQVFGLLLGPNNVVPTSAGLVAGVIVLISGLFQPVLFFLGFANAEREIRSLTLASIVGFGLFSLAVVCWRLGIVETLWAYAAYFTGATLLATLLLKGVGGHAPALQGAKAGTS